MRIKTAVILLIIILFTIVLLQNRDYIYFEVLWIRFFIPKLYTLLFAVAVGFLLGLMVSRPKQPTDHFNNDDYDHNNHNTLSDEDKDYIN
jgi:uncharacterized integral membrane protein